MGGAAWRASSNASQEACEADEAVTAVKNASQSFQSARAGSDEWETASITLAAVSFGAEADAPAMLVVGRILSKSSENGLGGLLLEASKNVAISIAAKNFFE